jgi:hypothetical protein
MLLHFLYLWIKGTVFIHNKCAQTGAIFLKKEKAESPIQTRDVLKRERTNN